MKEKDYVGVFRITYQFKLLELFSYFFRDILLTIRQLSVFTGILYLELNMYTLFMIFNNYEDLMI